MSSSLLDRILVGGHACSAIIIGHYAGLWAVLAAHPGRVWSIAELADEAGCKERWVREWVGVLSSAKLLSLSSSGELTCPDNIANRLLPDNGEIWLFTSLEFMLDKERRIADCFKKSGPLGLTYADYPNFHPWMRSWSETMIKADQYPAGYVDMIGEGLHDALKKGIKVLEPGCGNGLHVLALARQYPDSTFTAFDIDTALIQQVSKDCAQDNVTFVVADLTAMPEEWRAQFDYVMTFDTVHDVSHPALALAGVQRVLKPDALFTMEEVNTCSEMREQVTDPSSAVLYNISLHHCVPVSLGVGGVGVGMCWGVEQAQTMLREAGFRNVYLTTEQGTSFFVVKKGNGLNVKEHELT